MRGEDLETAVKEIHGSEVLRNVNWAWWEETAAKEGKSSPGLSFNKYRLDFKAEGLLSTGLPAREEASRCLKCAVFANMDLDSCCRESCRICERHCWKGAITAY